MAGAILGALLAGCEPSDELGSKSEWSILQAAEYRHRTAPSPETRLIYFDHDGYTAVGISADDQPGRVWILLNPKYRPIVKEMPQFPYHLSVSELEEIKNRTLSNLLVMDHLTGKVR